MADLVQITPEDFHKKSMHAIEDNINAKYANKVIQKIGLCICLYDLLWASEGLIRHGTGTANVNGTSSILGCRTQTPPSMINGRVSSRVPPRRLPSLQGRSHHGPY